MLDKQTFRNAMANFPSGVTIVTTIDRSGKKWGFTASSFSSVSMDPPLVLVCLAKSAESHASFKAAGRFSINVLKTEHEALAYRFAKKGIDKFAGVSTLREAEGGILFNDALVTLGCRTHSLVDAGDHTILLGEVTRADVNPGEPLLHYDRRFWDLVPSQNAMEKTAA
jgi:flavin reductase ActVB